MSNWWENDPVVESKEENWWDADPVIEEQSSTPSEDIRFKVQTDDSGNQFRMVPGVPTGDREETLVKETQDAQGNWNTDESRMANAKNQYDKANILKNAGKDLPLPGSQMYDNMNEEEADALFELYRNDPNTKMTATGLSYKGNQVPMPSKSLLEKVDIGIGPFTVGNATKGLNRIGEGAAKATMQMAQDAAVNIAAIGDEVVESTGKSESNMAKTLDEWLADYNPQGIIDTGVSEATKGAIAASIAAKIGGKKQGERPLRNDPRGPGSTASVAGNAIGRFAKSEAIYALGSNEASEVGFGKYVTDLIDLDSVKKNLQWSDDEKDFSSERLNSVMNVFAEGLIASGAMETVMRGAVGAGKFAKKSFVDPVIVFWSKEAQSKDAVKKIMQAASDLPENAPTQDKLNFYAKVKQILADPKNRKEIIDTGIEGLNKVEVDNTTMQTLEKGAKEQGMDQVAKNAIGVESDILRRDSPQTAGLITKQNEVLDDTLRAVEDFYGGEQGRNAARDVLIDTGEKEIAGAQADLVAKQSDLDREMSTLTNVIDDNPKVKEALEGVESQGVNVGGYSRQKQSEIADALINAERTMSKTEDAKYEAFIKAAGNMNVNPQFKEIYENAKEFLPPNLREFNSNKFSDAYRNIKPVLNKRIAAEMARNNENAVDALMALKDNLTNGQIDYFSASEGIKKQAAAKLGEEAKRYSAEVYQSIWSRTGDNPFAQMRRTIDRTTDVDNLRPEIGQASKAELSTKANQATGTIFSNEGREYVPLALKLLEQEGKTDLVSQYMIGKAAESFQGKLRAGGVEGLKEDDILMPLKQLAGAMGPEDQKAIADFIQAVKTKRGNIDELSNVLTEYATKAQEVEENIRGRVLKDFFINQAGVRSDMPPTQVFDSIVKSQDAEAKMYELLQLANKSENPKIVQDALYSAWYRNFRKEVMNAKGTLNTRVTTEMNDSFNKMYNIGKVVTKEDPTFIATTELISKLGDRELSQKLFSGKTIDINPNRIKMDAQNAVTKTINMFLGVLNKTSTRAKNISGAVIKEYNPADQYMEIIDNLNINKDLFNSYIDKVISDEQYVFSNASKDVMLKILSKSALSMGVSNTELVKSINESLGGPVEENPIESEMQNGALAK